MILWWNRARSCTETSLPWWPVFPVFKCNSSQQSIPIPLSLPIQLKTSKQIKLKWGEKKILIAKGPHGLRMWNKKELYLKNQKKLGGRRRRSDIKTNNQFRQPIYLKSIEKREVGAHYRWLLLLLLPERNRFDFHRSSTGIYIHRGARSTAAAAPGRSITASERKIMSFPNIW